MILYRLLLFSPSEHLTFLTEVMARAVAFFLCTTAPRRAFPCEETHG